MDFHTLKRKELQKLCKEHKLPANLTNLEMADKLSSFFKIEEKGKPTRKTRSCLKNCIEILSENDSDGLERKPKKVRFSPENDVFEFGNKKTEFVEYERNERGKSKRRDLEDKGVSGRVTRASKRASLGGKEVMISSPVVMKKPVKRVGREDEKSDNESPSVADLGSCVSDQRNEVITVKSLRNRTVQNVVLPKKIASMKNTQKQSENSNTEFSKNKDARVRITQPKTGLRRSTRNVKMSEESEELSGLSGRTDMIGNTKTSSGTLLGVSVPAADCEKESDSEAKNEDAHMIFGKGLRKKGAKNTTSKGKDVVSKTVTLEMNEIIPKPKKFVRRSKRNMELKEDYVNSVVELPNVDLVQKRNVGEGSVVGNESRKKLRQRTQARASVEDGEIGQPEKVPRRSKRHLNTLHTNIVDYVKEETKVTVKYDNSTRYQTRSCRERMPHIKQGKKEVVFGNLGPDRNTVEKDSSNQSRKSMMKKGSETKENVRRSKRNASVDDPVIISEDANGSCSDVRKSKTRKRGRDMILEEVPLQHTNCQEKLKRKTTVVSQTKSGQKDSPCQSRELVLPKHSETEPELRRSKRNANGADLPATYTDASITNSKKIVDTEEARAKTPNLADTKDLVSVGVAEMSTSCSVKLQSGQELDNELFSTKQTPVAEEPFRRLTRSAQKGNTDRPAFVRGKISQKKSHGLSKLPPLNVEASLPKATLNASDIVKDRTCAGLQDSFEEVSAKPPNLADPIDLVFTNEATSSPSFSVKLQTGQELVNELCVSKDTPVVREASSRRMTRSAIKSMTNGPAYVNQKLSQKKSQSISKLQLLEVEASLKLPLLDVEASLPEPGLAGSDIVKDAPVIREARLTRSAKKSKTDRPAYVNQKLSRKKSQSISKLQLLGVEASSRKATLTAEEPPNSACSMPQDKDNSTCSMPQDSSAKTHEITLYLQEPRGPGMTNIPEASSSERLKLHSIQDELVADISASKRAPVRSPASSDMQDCDTCANNEAHFVHLKPVNESDAAGDVVSIAGDVVSFDRSGAADGFSSLEQITSKVMEVSLEKNKFEEPSYGVVEHVVVEGSSIHEERSIDLFENKCSTNPVSSTNDADKDDTTQRDKSSEDNVASPHLTHMKPAEYSNVAAGDAYHIDTGSLAGGFSLVDQLTSTCTKERPQVSKDVESISREIDPSFGSEGADVHEQQPIYQLPSPEVVGINDNPNSAIEEKENNNIHLDVAEVATINEEKLGAETGDGGPTGKENDICYHSTGFAEGNGLEKDFGEASKKVGEATVDFTDGTVNMFFMEEKDETQCPEISALAAEQHNTCSLSRTQEKEFPAPSSILATEEVSVLDSAFPTPEVSDIVASLFSNKQLVVDSQQQISTPESCLKMEKSCTSNRIKISNLKEVGDSVAEGNNKSGPKSPSLLRATEVGNPVAEVNEVEEREESHSLWSSDTVAGRAAEDGNSLQKENNTVRSANVSVDNISKDSEDEFEIKNEVNVLDTGDSVAEWNNKSGPKSPSLLREIEVGDPVAEVNEEGEREESTSLWSADTVAGREAEAGNSSPKEQNTVRSAKVSVDNISKDSENEFDIKNEVNVLDSGDSVGERNNISGPKSPLLRAIEIGDLVAEVNEEVEREESPSLWTSDTVAVMAAEDSNSLQKEQNTFRSANVSVDNILKDSGDEFQIKNKVNVFGFSTKEGNYMKMSTEVSFDGKEYDGTGDMQELVSVSQAFDYNFGEGKSAEFGFGTSSSLKEIVICEANTEPINKGEECKYDDNQTVESASRRTSSTDSLKYKIIEESASGCPVVIDEAVFEDGTESLKGKSSALIDDLVEDGGGFEISDNVKAELVSSSVLEEDNYSNYTNGSHQSVKTLEQSGMSFWETNSQGKGIHREMDERSSLVDVKDMEGNNNADSIDITHRFDQEDDASGVPTEELPRKEDAMLTDAPAELVSGSEDQIPTEKTNEARGYSDILNPDSECGPEQSFFYSDIFGSELKSFLISDETGEKKSNSWSDRTNFMLHNSGDIGKKHENINISLAEEQLHIVHNVGEEHLREKGAGPTETQHAASDNHSPGNEKVSVENSAFTPSEAHFEPGNENPLKKVGSNSVKKNEDSTKTESR